jgi:parvulin-like peptidyl-prolyl isomerase
VEERIVAVVNEEIVLDTELEQWAVQTAHGPIDFDSDAGRKAWEQVKRKALEGLVDLKLEQQQAQELKLGVTPEEVDRAVEAVREQNKLDEATFREALKREGFTMENYRKTLKQQLLQMKVENTAVRSRVNVSDDEVRNYYNQNVRQLGSESEAHLRWVLVAVDKDAAAGEVERKKKTAQLVVDRAKAGTAFAELAKKYSDDPLSKEEGGDLGWVGHGVLDDALESAVQSMDAGDVRGPFRATRGFVVLQLVERKQSGVRPFDQVKDQLKLQLMDEQFKKAKDSWLRELRKKAHVEIRM